MGTLVDPSLQAIYRRLNEHGLDLSRYKESYLKRRLLVRIRALRLTGLQAYARHLRRHPAETGRLERALSIQVTRFFRNRGCYAFLEDKVVPELLRRAAKRGRRVAVWSAGCATGEEPWSLAALFAAALDRSGESVTVRVIATDIDEGALATARRAIYPARAFPSTVSGEVTRHFETLSEGRVSPALRLKRMVRFERESLLDPPAREDLDLIVCRNVLIYFSLEHQELVFGRFATSLSPGGCLVLGRVERLFGDARSRFESLSARDRVYRRLPDGGEGRARESRACA